MTAMLVLFGIWILLTVVLMNRATVEARTEKQNTPTNPRGRDPL